MDRRGSLCTTRLLHRNMSLRARRRARGRRFERAGSSGRGATLSAGEGRRQHFRRCRAGARRSASTRDCTFRHVGAMPQFAKTPQRQVSPAEAGRGEWKYEFGGRFSRRGDDCVSGFRPRRSSRASARSHRRAHRQSRHARCADERRGAPLSCGISLRSARRGIARRPLAANPSRHHSCGPPAKVGACLSRNMDCRGVAAGRDHAPPTRARCENG